VSSADKCSSEGGALASSHFVDLDHIKCVCSFNGCMVLINCGDCIVTGTMIHVGVLELHRQPDIWENPEVYRVTTSKHFMIIY